MYTHTRTHLLLQQHARSAPQHHCTITLRYSKGHSVHPLLSNAALRHPSRECFILCNTRLRARIQQQWLITPAMMLELQHHSSHSERFELLVPSAGGRGEGPGGLSPPGRGRSRGRGGGRGRGPLPSPSSPEDNVPSLEACLANIQQLQNTPRLQANPSAYLLYNLGKRVNIETRGGAQLSSEHESILAAADTVAQEVFHYALEEQLPDLLDRGQKCNSQDVSNIALACAYVEFKGNLEPFISAVASRLREQGASNVMADAKPQAWSNLIWVCGKLVDLKGGNSKALGEGVSIIMQEGAAAMERAVNGPMGRQVTAQALSNALWGLAHFDWFDAGVIKVLAGAFVQRIRSSVPQAVANVLLALSSLGWYDCAVYDELLGGLVKSTGQLAPQAMSNAMYSCAVARHSGPAIDALAHVASKQDLSGWNEHDVSNALYAWAVLSLLGIASEELNEMALVLFIEANSRGPAAFHNAIQMRQLHAAHMEAVRVGLQGGGLSAADGLQQAAAEQHRQYQANLAKSRWSGASAAQTQAMAALQQAGYEVQLGSRVGEDGYAVDLLVQHQSCPGGLVMGVVRADDFFNHPQRLDGKVLAVQAQIRQRCAGLVVLTEAEAGQPDVVVLALQQELAKASGQGGC